MAAGAAPHRQERSRCGLLCTAWIKNEIPACSNGLALFASLGFPGYYCAPLIWSAVRRAAAEQQVAAAAAEAEQLRALLAEAQRRCGDLQAELQRRGQAAEVQAAAMREVQVGRLIALHHTLSCVCLCMFPVP